MIWQTEASEALPLRALGHGARCAAGELPGHAAALAGLSTADPRLVQLGVGVVRPGTMAG